jgi:hypothetical protein
MDQWWIRIEDGFLDWSNHRVHQSEGRKSPTYHVPYISREQRGWSIDKAGSASGNLIVISLSEQQLRERYPGRLALLDEIVFPGVVASRDETGRLVHHLSDELKPDTLKGTRLASKALKPADVIASFQNAGFDDVYRVQLGLSPHVHTSPSISATIGWALISVAGFAWLI